MPIYFGLGHLGSQHDEDAEVVFPVDDLLNLLHVRILEVLTTPSEFEQLTRLKLRVWPFQIGAATPFLLL